MEPARTGAVYGWLSVRSGHEELRAVLSSRDRRQLMSVVTGEAEPFCVLVLVLRWRALWSELRAAPADDQPGARDPSLATVFPCILPTPPVRLSRVSGWRLSPAGFPLISTEP